MSLFKNKTKYKPILVPTNKKQACQYCIKQLPNSELSSQELLANSSSQAEARLLARTEVDARRELHNGTNNAGDPQQEEGLRNLSREDIMLNSTFVLF